MQNIEDKTSEFYNQDYIEERTREAIADYLADPFNESEGGAVSLSQIRFNALLRHCGRYVFGRSGAMVAPSGRYGKRYNLGVGLVALAVYVDICDRFDKVPSMQGFANFSTIEADALRDWKKDTQGERRAGREAVYSTIYSIYNSNLTQDIEDKSIFWEQGEMLTALKVFILEKLHTGREEGIQERLIDSKNPVGVLSVANHLYGWNAEQIAQEERAKALALSELPQLMLTKRSEKQGEDIAESL